jgi:DNA replication and repair protein RecF
MTATHDVATHAPREREESSEYPRTELAGMVARNFRNLRSVELQIPPAGIVLVGENGQGKSGFLEAVRYLTVLRSQRASGDAELVRHGEQAFFISGAARTPTQRQLSAGYDRVTRTKRVSVDGVVAERLSDAFGVVVSTLLSPADSLLLNGAPGDRRRYMDVLLALCDARYLAALQQYRAALARRNAALRSAAAAAAAAAAEGAGDIAHGGHAEAWERLLAESGSFLWRSRIRWCEAIAADFTRLCGAIGETAVCRLELQRSRPGVTPDAESLAHALASERARDVNRGFTGAGPHRDDLRITADGFDLRSFGSGGQHRTAALALRLIETLTLRDALGLWPLLLLDDPFAELDARRAANVLALVEETGHGQVVLAVPRDDDVPAGFTRFDRLSVRGGEIAASRL